MQTLVQCKWRDTFQCAYIPDSCKLQNVLSFLSFHRYLELVAKRELIWSADEVIDNREHYFDITEM